MDMQRLLADYEEDHQSPVCKATHAVGIPLIALSVPMLAVNRRSAVAFFLLGWALQFAGHAAEGKRPTFFEGFEYLLAGLVWWVTTVPRLLKGAVGHP